MKNKLQTQLTRKLVARLAMRWPQAGAYVPTGSLTVHTASSLDDEDRTAFDSYILGYQDAIEDAMRHLSVDGVEPAPYALQLAENSPFQGGSPAPMPARRNRPRHSRHASKPSSARQKLENLFGGGGQ